MFKINDTVNGFIAKVNIIDRASGEVVQENVIMKCEHHASIEDLNKDLLKFGLPSKFEFIEWVS